MTDETTPQEGKAMSPASTGSAPLHGDVVRLPRMPYGSFVVDKHRTEWANGFLYALEVVKAELNAAGVAWKDENDDE